MDFFSEQDIYEIAESIWLPVLNMGLHLAPEGAGLDRPDWVSGKIGISGAWHGHVVLQCSRPLARQAAAVMFALEADDASDDDLDDALQELVNMFGGTVKGALPQPCELTLPAVGGLDPHESAIWTHFSCHGEPLRVAIALRAAA